jgi:hypothetical protein
VQVDAVKPGHRSFIALCKTFKDLIDSDMEQIELEIETLINYSRAILQADKFKKRESASLC